MVQIMTAYMFFGLSDQPDPTITLAFTRSSHIIRARSLRPLHKAEPPIIPPLLSQHHKKLVDDLHEIQREQHPHINSITAVTFDATLNFRDAYMEYIPNYPIAAYRIDEEMANNLAFKTFVDVSRLFIYTSFRCGFFILTISLVAKCSPSGCSSSRHENFHKQAYSSFASL
jgi:hypothetical protein